VQAVKDGKEEVLLADVVLVSTGRRPFTEGLGLEALGVAMDRGMITTDDHFKTNVDSIFAIGDVIKGPMLAHKAEDEALACIELMAGKAGHINYDASSTPRASSPLWPTAARAPTMTPRAWSRC
jgi:dihydrolipoamide dehydrogenase